MFGGIKVVLRHADLLTQRGYRATVVSPGAPPDWYAMTAPFVQVGGLTASRPKADVTVATYWTTIEPALASAEGQVVHFCQGFEGLYTHNRAEHPQIDAVYHSDIPAWTVAPHLSALLRRRFGRPSRVVLQPLEPVWAPVRCRWRPHRPPRVLIVSPFEIDWKGVATGLQAVRRLRQAGLDCRLVRLSQWPLTVDERAILEPDEYHCALPLPEVVRLLRTVDLLLAPSWEAEGFGLPVLEAMASGVPVVASDIASFRDFASSAAVLVPPEDPDAFASAARRVLGDPRRWRRMRRLGLQTARRYAEPAVVGSIASAVEWVASGAWRDERPRRDLATPR